MRRFDDIRHRCSRPARPCPRPADSARRNAARCNGPVMFVLVMKVGQIAFGPNAVLRKAARRGSRSHKQDSHFFRAIASAASVNAALAASGQPFDNLQPSLAVTELMLSHGVFPSLDEGGSALGGTLGFVYDFAGSALPGTTLAANGQIFPVGPNTALFSLMGTTYGGNGITNFALPDLQGKAIIGAGAGPGLTPRTLGAAVGSSTASLISAQLPARAASSRARLTTRCSPRCRCRR